MTKMIDHTRISTVIISTLNKSCSCIFVYFVFLKIINYASCSIFFLIIVLCPLQCPNFLHLLNVTFILVLKSVENFLLKMDPSLGKKKKKGMRRGLKTQLKENSCVNSQWKKSGFSGLQRLQFATLRWLFHNGSNFILNCLLQETFVKQ